MSNILYIPRLNPLVFYEVSPTTLPQYLTKFYDDFQYRFTLQPWEEPACYCQKIMKVDRTHLQFNSNYDPIQIDVVNNDGNVVSSVNATQRLQNKYNPGFYAYEATINWSIYPVGIYQVQIIAGGLVNLVSEPINLAEMWANTLNFEYNNSRYHADIIPTGILQSFRIEGHFGRILPGSNDQVYEDQKLNPRLLSSKTFNAFKLTIGGTIGIPDWAIEKMKLIWSCNNVMIDGKLFAKSGEGGFSYTDEELYPMRGIEMEIREGINRTSKVVSGDFNINKKMVVQSVIDTRLFGGIGTDQTMVVTGFE